MNSSPEFLEVEQPFLDLLVAMGWKSTVGRLEDPGATCHVTSSEF